MALHLSVYTPAPTSDCNLPEGREGLFYLCISSIHHHAWHIVDVQLNFVAYMN